MIAFRALHIVAVSLIIIHLSTSKRCCPLQVWSTNQPNSVSEIDIKANVCCAKYNPGSSYEIAVGAADHTVLTYDLRRSDRAVHTFRGEPAYRATSKSQCIEAKMARLRDVRLDLPLPVLAVWTALTRSGLVAYCQRIVQHIGKTQQPHHSRIICTLVHALTLLLVLGWAGFLATVKQRS